MLITPTASTSPFLTSVNSSDDDDGEIVGDTTAIIDIVLSCNGLTCTMDEVNQVVDEINRILGPDTIEIISIDGNNVSILVCGSDFIRDFVTDLFDGLYQDIDSSLQDATISSVLYNVDCDNIDYYDFEFDETTSSSSLIYISFFVILISYFIAI